ncbi:MAG: guanylate kinase [Bacteroidota bacterium]
MTQLSTSSGKLIIFSAPSGAGKTTIVKHLINQFPDQLGFSISACTRDKRGRREVHGRDYYFMSKEEFEQKIQEEAFVEWEQVYMGAYYGTLKSEIRRIWEEGKAVLFDVDVQGGLKLKEYFKEAALAVFVKVTSVEVLKERLRERNTESDAKIETRLAKAIYEMSFEERFDYILLNDTLTQTLQEAEQLTQEFLKKDSKQNTLFNL